MRRRGTVNRKPAKTQHRKPTRPKRSNPSMAAGQVHSSISDLQEQLKHRARELQEARDERAALAEVLRVISSSPGNLQPVFQAVLENATRLCEASFGALLLHEDDGAFRIAALHNAPPAYVEVQRRKPVTHASPLTPHGRAAATKQLLHIADLTEDIAYKAGDPLTVWFTENTGARTLLLVPMLKQDELIGVTVIYRREVQPFTDKTDCARAKFRSPSCDRN